MSAASGACLVLSDVNAWYRETQALRHVSLRVHEGEVVSLLGRNGSGRTTTLKATMGLTRRAGSILLNGTETVALPTYRIARLGLGYCPEDRGIFASLSAQENLDLPPSASANAVGLDEIYAMFPNLAERKLAPGMRLSGGEQQMLAIARTLRAGARILLLDEISEGLAPVIVQTLDRLIRDLKARGYTILLVEQNFRFAAGLADRFYVMDHGKIVMEFERSALSARKAELERILGL